MSKFDLRDISDRLTASRSTEAVVFEFLGYLQAQRGDWRASLAFYEVSRDALVAVYERQGKRLVRKDISLPVDRLPPRLVRKFFHPSAFFNHADRRSMLTQLFNTAPCYEPDPTEIAMLTGLVPAKGAASVLCLPMTDHEDMLGMLVLASEQKNAFGGRTVSQVLPIKSLAALALSQHLHRSAREKVPAAQEASAHQAAARQFQEHIQQLSTRAASLEEENRSKADQLDALAGEIEKLDKSSTEYRGELHRVKTQLFALEEQSAAATQHLTEAYSELSSARLHTHEMHTTVAFLKDVFQVLAQEHDEDDFSRTLVAWFCEHFGVERCSLMVLDEHKETLQIAAHRGIAPEIASRVRVRIGQGVAGWVAHNRKPLFVRVKEEAHVTAPGGGQAYNSDSFICVPLIYNGRLCGVLNLSNKRDAELFEEVDLDRAVMAGALLAMMVGRHETARRSAAWS
ncbi:MAG: GAF domain-containing protein [Candidatus Eisenbacteria bacterium]